MSKKNILILGSGFGGLTVLNRLSRSLRNRKDIQITLMDRNNYFLFSPLLHEVAESVLSPENILTPVRKLISSNNVNFVQANVESINLSQKQAISTVGIHDYDYLVLALGGVTDNSTIENVGDNINLLTLKTIQDAIAIKNHVINALEKAAITTDRYEVKRLLTFGILGGGYTGVQFAAGLSDAIYECLNTSYHQINLNDIRIVLLESENRVIRDLPEKHSLYVTKHLQKRRIEVKLNSRVTGIKDNRVEINGGEFIEFQTLVYVPGIVATPVVSTLGVPTGDRARVIVNEYLEIEGTPGVYAIGDCAHFQDPISNQPSRPRAHIAVRQARTVAKNIIADLNSNKPTQYIYSDTEEIMSLGRSNALLRLRRIWIHGIPAVLVWVMSYSLLAFGRKNRLKIAIDWILSFIYGPDFTIIKPLKKKL